MSSPRKLSSFAKFAIAALVLNALGWAVFIALGLGAKDKVAVRNGPSAPAPISVAQVATVARKPVEAAKEDKVFYFRYLKVVPSGMDGFDVSAGFSETPQFKTARDFISCEPALTLKHDMDSGRLIFSGKFKPGETYTFKFRKGMPTSEGAQLQRDVTASIAIPLPVPALEFAASGRYLPPGGQLLIPVKSINVKRLKATVARVPAHNIVQLAARDDWRYGSWRGEVDGAETFELTTESKVRELSIPAEANKTQESQLNLADFTDAQGKGVYLVQIENGGAEKSEPRHRLVCVSDIGLSAREIDDSLLVWATSLREGTPLAGIKLKLYYANNTTAAEGETSAEGLVTLAIPKRSESRAFLLLASSADGRDVTFLTLSNSFYLGSSGTGRARLKTGESEAFVFSDRGIYRHGDPVFVQAILRNHEGRAPAPFPVTLEVAKPGGKIFKTIPLMPDESGSVVPKEAIVIGEDQPSGHWTFRLLAPGSKNEIGKRVISVESFVPPQIRVSVRDLPDSLEASGSIGFSVFSEYLFGRPADGLKVTPTVVYEDAPFAPKGWAAYRFGDVRRTRVNQVLTLKEGVLDEQGIAKFSASLPKSLTPAAAVRVTVQGTVLEPAGRPVSARASTVLHASPFYAGIHTDGRFVVTDKANTFKLAAVLPDGKRRPEPTQVDVSVSEVTWNYNVIEANGHYEWRSEQVRIPVHTETLTLAPDADTPFVFTPGLSTSYELAVATADGSVSSTMLFYSGSDAAQGREYLERDSDSLKIVLDKDSYRPGETARIKVLALFPSTALIVVRTPKGVSTFVRKVDAGQGGIVDFPVGEDAWPGLSVSATLVRPAVEEPAWLPHRFSGTKTVPVRRAEMRLGVKAESVVKIKDGGAVVDVVASVTGDGGVPVSGDAFATVMLTDEAILMLTREAKPDPAKFFETEYDLVMLAFDMFERLIPVVKADKVLGTDAVPGGGDAGSLLGRISPVSSRRFQPLSRWVARVPVKDGVAKTHFDLPEFSGEVRVTAVAWTGAATGSAKEQVKIKPLLVAKADGPRFLAPGDKADVVLSLYNESGQAGAVSVTAAFAGCTGEFAPARIELPVGASREVHSVLTAPDGAGTAVVTFKVSGFGETHIAEVPFPVRPAAAWETVYTDAVVAPGAQAVFAVPPTHHRAFAEQTFQIMNTPGVELLPALKFLTTYPYGCVEQTTSSVFPLVAAHGEAGALLAGDAEFAAQAKDFVQIAVDRLGTMLQYDGFSFWPNAGRSSVEYSLYAAHFIIEATQSGAAKNDSLKTETLKILRSKASSSNASQSAYATRILAIAGMADRNAMLALYDKRTELAQEASAHLASAFALSGDIPRARILLEQITPATVTELAFAVIAQLDADPASPRAARWLDTLRRRATYNRHWGTTWDNAHALLACAAYARHTGAGVSSAAFTLSGAGGSTHRIVLGKEGAVDGKPLANGGSYQLKAGGDETVTLHNEGTSPVYVFHAVKSIPVETSSTPVAKGISIVRKFYDLKGNPLASDSLQQGDTVVVGLEVGFSKREELSAVDQVVVEDLLPACFETSLHAFVGREDYPWIPPHDTGWILHREVRDDRVLLFSNTLNVLNR
ncbi:MAG: hypothetical protein LBV54_05345, partial [Puniceicoccales bacterium]|nr:hypothetical protein [Puniceicoccales bacterium]